jgi:hypothetical protein
MLLDGQKVETVAKACGVERTIVSRWAAEVRDEANARVTETMAGAVDGAAKARAAASSATPEAIDVVVEIMRNIDAGPGDNVRLAAAKTILDRGGVPVRTDVDIASNVSIADLIADKAKREK